MKGTWAKGITVAAYYNNGATAPADNAAGNVTVVGQKDGLVISPTTPDPTPKPDDGSSAYAMAALGAGLALLSAF